MTVSVILLTLLFGSIKLTLTQIPSIWTSVESLDYCDGDNSQKYYTLYDSAADYPEWVQDEYPTCILTESSQAGSKTTSVISLIFPITSSNPKRQQAAMPQEGSFVGAAIQMDRGHLLAVTNGGPDVFEKEDSESLAVKKKQSKNIVPQYNLWQRSRLWRKWEKLIWLYASNIYGWHPKNKKKASQIAQLFNEKPDQVVQIELYINPQDYISCVTMFNTYVSEQDKKKKKLDYSKIGNHQCLTPYKYHGYINTLKLYTDDDTTDQEYYCLQYQWTYSIEGLDNPPVWDTQHNFGCENGQMLCDGECVEVPQTDARRRRRRRRLTDIEIDDDDDSLCAESTDRTRPPCMSEIEGDTYSNDMLYDDYAHDEASAFNDLSVKANEKKRSRPKSNEQRTTKRSRRKK